MFEDQNEALNPCPICGGESALIGILGKLVWMRCMYCGTEFHIPAADIISTEDETEEEE